MSLILKDKVPMLKKGYPTVSDKYNVSGGILTGTVPVKFGELVKRSGTAGYFEAITEQVQLADIVGFALATNVKLAQDYPGTTVQINPGEAFNLMIDGFIAIELDNTAKVDDIIPNSNVYVNLGTGKLTTSSNANAEIVALPNCVFTGIYENHGTAQAPVYFAEIFIK